MGAIRPKVILQEAKALEQKGQLKEASRKYAFLIQPLMKRGKATEALIVIDKILEISPTSTRLYLTKSLCFVELQRHREAYEEIERFALAAVRQKRITNYLQLIKEKAKANPGLQQKFFEKLLTVERTRSDVFFDLAQVLFRQGETLRAYEMVFSGLKVEPKSELGLKVLKQFITDRGRKDDFQSYEKLIKGESSLEAAREQLCEGLNDTAESQFKIPPQEGSYAEGTILKSLDEENAGTLKNLIQELEEELGDRPKGIETITGLVNEFKDKALFLLKDDATTILDLAVAFREMGLLVEAREAIVYIDKTNERYCDAQSLLGEIEFESGALVAGLDIFQSLLRADGLKEDCQKNALYHIVRIYMELQDFKKASHFADKLSKIDSNYRNLPRLRSELINRMEK